ncbi:hypothetical protein E5358_12655 [Palleniella muris]|uniref:Uncharacterized protein n=1 Tax=Palleniella muris TaxID=3038145 RepID=A0AC61QMM1_9BACT|nr:phage antirepressor KilAC domain-containing protein [Palleniella muris]TGX80501.1 hypothetical protein E5358_12655 [Palleniella muris]
MEQLTRTSDAVTIKRYFDGILELSRQHNEFPVDLDDVWMLAYSRKNEAARALRRDFMEHVDYQVLRRNAENLKGGRPTEKCMLSLPCLEYFIARKVRPVFEVYRMVFHRATEEQSVPRSFAEALQLAADQQKKIEEQELQIRLNNIKMAEDKPKVDFVDDYVDMPEQTGDVTLTELAQMICAKGYEIGSRRLCEWLREHKYLYKDDKVNMPTQYSLNLKLMTIYKFDRCVGNDGRIKIRRQTKVTPKGQLYFCDKFRQLRENGELKLPKRKVRTVREKLEEFAQNNPEFKKIWDRANKFEEAQRNIFGQNTLK